MRKYDTLPLRFHPMAGIRRKRAFPELCNLLRALRELVRGKKSRNWHTT